MTKPADFDPDDPIDAIGETLRQGVLDLMLRAMDMPQHKSATPEQRAQGEVGGLLMGVCCALLSAVRPEAHTELRSVVIEQLPYFFDNALTSGGFEPLGPMRAGADAFSESMQYRLQSVLGGLPVVSAINLLAGQIGVMLVTSCTSKEAAKRAADDVRAQLRDVVLKNFDTAQIAAVRDTRLADARRRLN